LNIPTFYIYNIAHYQHYLVHAVDNDNVVDIYLCCPLPSPSTSYSDFSHHMFYTKDILYKNSWRKSKWV